MLCEMNKKRLNQFLIPLLYHFVCIGVWAETLPDHTQEWQTVYEEKFDQVGNDELPDDFFVLDGEFKVTSKDGRKCLAMSGTPVGEHGFLFGPRLAAESIELSFSCLGGFKSRRHNVFAGALGGIRGLKFRVNPTSREIILFYADDWQREFAVNWSSTEWMRIKLRLEWNSHKEQTDVELEVCKEAVPEQSMLRSSTVVDGKIRSGKCAVWGFSYAEEKMYWDHLLIRSKI